MVDHKECSLLDEHIASNQRKVSLTCVVNGVEICDTIDPTMTLLHFLRDRLKFFGTKESCGEGECGACPVIMNGKAVTSCIILALEVLELRSLLLKVWQKTAEFRFCRKNLSAKMPYNAGFALQDF